jgi:sec-independent protein translocase protein TatA
LKLLFFDFGAGEIMLVVLAVLLVFGPGKIPEIARTLGKFINEIKHASEDIKTEINREADRIDRDKRLAEYKATLEAKTDDSIEESKNQTEVT